jgi:hypothetical protein
MNSEAKGWVAVIGIISILILTIVFICAIYGLRTEEMYYKTYNHCIDQKGSWTIQPPTVGGRGICTFHE